MITNQVIDDEEADEEANEEAIEDMQNFLNDNGVTLIIM